MLGSGDQRLDVAGIPDTGWSGSFGWLELICWDRASYVSAGRASAADRQPEGDSSPYYIGSRESDFRRRNMRFISRVF